MLSKQLKTQHKVFGIIYLGDVCQRDQENPVFMGCYTKKLFSISPLQIILNYSHLCFSDSELSSFKVIFSYLNGLQHLKMAITDGQRCPSSNMHGSLWSCIVFDTCLKGGRCWPVFPSEVQNLNSKKNPWSYLDC